MPFQPRLLNVQYSLTVVVLTEQMRLQYHQLLTRVRNTTLIQTDVDLISARSNERYEQTGSHIYYLTNCQQIESSACSQESKAKIILFPARPYPMGEGHALFDVDKLLELQDDSNVKIPGLLCRLLSTRLGIVNGARS